MNPTTAIKGLFTALAVGLIITACDIVRNITYPGWGQDPNFNFVCEEIGKEFGDEYRVACFNHAKPLVIITAALNDLLESYGFTFVAKDLADMEPYIYIHPDSPHYNTTIQHEFAHWILRMLEIDDWDSWDTCDREMWARKLSGPGDEWNERKAAAYGCPAPDKPVD